MCTFYSETFYTSPGDYRLYILVNTGSDDHKGTHMSVYWTLIERLYDCDLEWPYDESVTVEPLNQLVDNDQTVW